MVFNSEKSLMRTGLFSSRTKMISYLLLRFIADKDEPAGSWVLREDLLSFGIDCSTATIGRYLKELDYREYTVQKSNQGRVLTPIGQAHLEELEERLERTRMQEKLSKAMKVTEYGELIELLYVRRALETEAARQPSTLGRRISRYLYVLWKTTAILWSRTGIPRSPLWSFMRSWPTSATTSLFAPF